MSSSNNNLRSPFDALGLGSAHAVWMPSDAYQITRSNSTDSSSTATESESSYAQTESDSEPASPLRDDEFICPPAPRMPFQEFVPDSPRCQDTPPDTPIQMHPTPSPFSEAWWKMMQRREEEEWGLVHPDVEEYDRYEEDEERLDLSSPEPTLATPALPMLLKSPAVYENSEEGPSILVRRRLKGYHRDHSDSGFQPLSLVVPTINKDQMQQGLGISSPITHTGPAPHVVP